MSAYLSQEESRRKWQITLAAGIAAATDLLLLMVTA
jgi:hypothetical protein